MSNKIASDWLSGRLGNPERPGKVDLYAQEKSNLTLIPAQVSQFSGPDSPYNRSYTDPVDLDLLMDCLVQMDCTHDPLPIHLSLLLQDEIRLLQSNRPGNILRYGKNPTLHPDEALMQRYVVGYVEGVKVRGFDDNPIKTIKDELGISKSSYYDWKKKYTWYVNFSPDVMSDEKAKALLRWIWGKLIAFYKQSK